MEAKKDFRFWMLFVSLCVACFLSALEFVAIGNALPSIVSDLSEGNEAAGEEFAWLGTAYTLASTAFLPFSGCVAESFGRRVAVVLFLVIFAFGSALCGAAQSMNWLIAARTVQGIGGGAIHSLATIVIADLVPLAERGTYNGFVGLTWAVAVAVGPLISGSLAANNEWRWLFYLNLPICAIALILVILFLDLPTPEGSVREKFSRMDWTGNLIIAASSTALVIGLTWGGVRYEWTSFRVLVPLILGAVGLVIFGFYEAFLAEFPIFPPSLFSNRTSASGYAQIALNMTSTVAVTYYVPVYYQACFDANAIRAGVMTLGMTVTVGVFIVIGGVSVTILRRYRPQIWFAWSMTIIGLGLATTLDEKSSVSKAVGYFTLGGTGVGALFGLIYFPVLSPLPVDKNAHALALFAFLRSFAQVWGITIGSTILSNRLIPRLPTAILENSGGAEPGALVYALIPRVRDLPQPIKDQTRRAFAESFQGVWIASVAIFGAGLAVSFFMADVPLHKHLDRKWSENARKAEKKEADLATSSQERSESSA
ncbi:major facilitator superfamily domain-containing protein [Pterulicium gracile]|uniref:Major facilitator superfamily domain-containing protein n=1 Tax=Pterulicium gracile TaxID=1884261 RepID=A0A5C3QAN9_9AGAR|nr:major facilitator superfamily domain-containing protein [Pterula gracilis]